MVSTSTAASTSVDEGSIAAGTPGAIISKYTFHWSWVHSQSGIPIPLTFNINSDVAVPSFRSTALTVSYDPTKGQPSGFMGFDGIIGGGKICITIRRVGVVINGPIEGGPRGGQSFIGSGTWISG